MAFFITIYQDTRSTECQNIYIQLCLTTCEINIDFMSTALNKRERYDVRWWRYFTGNFLRNQLTWQHRLHLSPPISDWMWSHRIGIKRLLIINSVILESVRLQCDIWGSDGGLAPYQFCTKWSCI